MSDYMYMLENHLTAAQNRVVAEVQRSAAEANLSVFLTGGAIRDMFGSFLIRDLDFTVEGPALQLAQTVSKRMTAEVVLEDANRKTAELVSTEGSTFEIGMARTERYANAGAKPQVTPATVHEDLRRRDFTINALGLSLNRGSRGLLLDPTNGIGDLQAKEIRSTNSSIFHDSPVRLLRLLRLRERLGYTVVERTSNQYQNAREAQVEQSITTEELLDELRHAATEPNLAEVLQAWDQEGLLKLVTPALTGADLNIPTFQKLQKFRQSLPFGLDLRCDDAAVFFALLVEKLPPKDKAVIAELDGEHSADWLKLAARSAKLEKELGSPSLQKASKIYSVLSKAPGEQITYLVLRSAQRVVQDRIRNYLTKYVAAAHEVTDSQVIEAGAPAGTPKFEKTKADLISKRLDARPKKPEAEAEIA